jgi:hypothetical protein
MADLSEPPRLGEFLDAGCDLGAVYGLDPEFLAGLVDIPNPTQERTAMWAGYYRETAEAWVRGEPSWMDRVVTIPYHHTQGELCQYAWAADALEDPALAAIVVGRA